MLKSLEMYSKINNNNHIVKINYRKAGDEKISLFMSYRKQINGRSINYRKTMNIILDGNKKEDAKKIELAMAVRNEFEKNLGSGINVFENDSNRIFLIDYVINVSVSYANIHSKKNIKAIASHLKKMGCTITLGQVDRRFVIKFMNYLEKACPKASGFYFTKFKQVLYRAMAEELINDLPFLRKLSIKNQKPVREYLTYEELLQFKNCEHIFVNKNYKNAFIFSCFTGLRFVDLSKLKFENISNNYLSFIQEKTKEHISMKLHPVALAIYQEQKQITDRDSGLLFDITSYESWRISVLKMIKEAGIKKHITGHCARHTFATMCLTYDVPITTISKLLGHTDIKHTQVYAKLIDKKKDEAIDLLPEI